MAWEKQSGKPVESEFLLDNVEALAMNFILLGIGMAIIIIGFLLTEPD